VPFDERAPCAFPGCGRPATLVKVETSGLGITPPFGGEGTVTTAWCADDAVTEGYVETRSSEHPPEHLNILQRFVVDALSHGDPPTAKRR
jgi:hypothetical protein